MNFKWIALAICGGLGLQANGQNEYDFAFQTGEYKPLENAQIIQADDFGAMVPIGFDFIYFGDKSTEVYLGIPGSVDLNGGWMHGIEGDFGKHPSRDTYMAYTTEGTAPNRIFKAEWRNLGTNSDSAEFDSVNFQIWFLEKSQSIEFHNGPSYLSQSAIDGGVFVDKHAGPNLGIFNFQMHHHAVVGSPNHPMLERTSNMSFMDGLPVASSIYRFSPATKICLLSGQGGAKLKASEEFTLKWNRLIPGASLEYSTDAGSTWYLIANDVQDSSYVWTIPQTPTSMLVFRVKDGNGDEVVRSEYWNRIVESQPDGVRGIEVKEEVLMYPNPASQYVTIDVKIDARIPVYVYDSKGQMVACIFVEQGKNHLDLSRFRKGMYSVAIYTLPDVVVRKILVVQ